MRICDQKWSDCTVKFKTSLYENQFREMVHWKNSKLLVHFHIHLSAHPISTGSDKFPSKIMFHSKSHFSRFVSSRFSSVSSFPRSAYFSFLNVGFNVLRIFLFQNSLANAFLTNFLRGLFCFLYWLPFLKLKDTGRDDHGSPPLDFYSSLRVKPSFLRASSAPADL